MEHTGCSGRPFDKMHKCSINNTIYCLESELILDTTTAVMIDVDAFSVQRNNELRNYKYSRVLRWPHLKKDPSQLCERSFFYTHLLLCQTTIVRSYIHFCLIEACNSSTMELGSQVDLTNRQRAHAWIDNHAMSRCKPTNNIPVLRLA